MLEREGVGISVQRAGAELETASLLQEAAIEAVETLKAEWRERCSKQTNNGNTTNTRRGLVSHNTVKCAKF